MRSTTFNYDKFRYSAVCIRNTTTKCWLWYVFVHIFIDSKFISRFSILNMANRKIRHQENVQTALTDVDPIKILRNLIGYAFHPVS